MTRQITLASVFPIGLLTALVLVGGSPTSARAGAESAEQMATPRPQSCDVERRSPEEILTLTSPGSENGTLGSGRLIQPLPVGTPADVAASAGVSATISQLEACINDGQVFRAMALFSDEALRRMPISEEAAAEFSMMATGTPIPVPPGERSVFIGPWHVERLPDGRVLAAVVWFGSETDSCINPKRINALVFIEQDGQWLIDERIEDVADGELIDVVGLPPATTTLKACVGSESFGEPTDN